MMGKLSTAPISGLDSKEVIVTDTNTLEPPEIEVNTRYKGIPNVSRYTIQWEQHYNAIVIKAFILWWLKKSPAGIWGMV